MSDQSHIDDALHSGLRAAESLLTWQKGSEAHRLVRDRIWTIQRGITAMDRLSRNLREGRMHVAAPHDDDQAPRPSAANLEKAAPGYEICSTCEGEGTQMEMKCYGGEPCEETTHCDTCNGEGQVEIDTPEGEAARAAAAAAVVATTLAPVVLLAPAPAPVQSFEQMCDSYDDLVRKGMTVEARMALKGWLVTFSGDTQSAPPQQQ